MRRARMPRSNQALLWRQSLHISIRARIHSLFHWSYNWRWPRQSLCGVARPSSASRGRACCSAPPIWIRWLHSVWVLRMGGPPSYSCRNSSLAWGARPFFRRCTLRPPASSSRWFSSVVGWRCAPPSARVMPCVAWPRCSPRWRACVAMRQRLTFQWRR